MEIFLLVGVGIIVGIIAMVVHNENKEREQYSRDEAIRRRELEEYEQKMKQ
jgi:hypothetical protein